VATLFLGLAVIVSWLVFGLLAGLLGALGAGAAHGFEFFRAASALLAGSVAGLLLWGFSFGQTAVARTRVRVAIPGLDPELDGLRVVQISDLHIGNGLEGERLARLVERTNALEPDVIVITGDIFDFDPAFVEDGLRRLAHLRARAGVYAILGNHDVYTGLHAVVEGFAAFAPGIRLLRDERVALPLARPLYLAGVEDPGQDWSARGVELASIERLASERTTDGPTLLLVHRPECFPQAARLGFPLVLAGHTHGGQVALPTPGGPWNLARIVTRFTRGLYRQGESVLYVTRGVGVGGPALRVNCSREITTLVLAAG
jgi:predicted MPP superfamily phosphohydrolase